MLLAKGLSARHVMRFRNVVAGVVLVVLAVHAARWCRQRHGGAGSAEVGGDGALEAEYLARLADTYGLANRTLQWRAWRIRPAAQPEPAESCLTRVDAAFARQPARTVDLRAPDRAGLRASGRLELRVRGGGGDADGSAFLFGISTSYDRVAHRDWAVLRAWERWLTRGGTGRRRDSNGAHLLIMLDRATDEQLLRTGAALRDSGISAHVMATDEPLSLATRYYELVRVLKAHGAALAAAGRPKTWFALVDDSVFFPGLARLAARLGAYRAADALYLGLPSERRDWHDGGGGGLETHGGGAVVLTRAAVARILQLPCLDAADRSAPARPKRWDAQLGECVRRGGGIDVRAVPGLYSPAADGPRPHGAGLETDAPPLVLRDARARHGLDAGMAHRVADACGDACFMQRYLFRDDWVLVNGVSISQHPDGLERRRSRRRRGHGGAPAAASGDRPAAGPGRFAIDDGGEQAERTLLAPRGRRNVWRLLDAATAADGAVWQAYLNKGTGSKAGPGEMDSVIVLIWEAAAP